MEPLKITLAGQEFSINPLTLGQIEDLSVAVVLPEADDPQENVRRSFNRSLGILAAALRKQHPDMTADALRDMAITREELTESNSAILRFSGLVAQDKTPGEAEPAATPA